MDGREHLIEHNAQRIDICPLVYPASLGLLRGDIVHRPQCFPRQGIAGARDAGNAKICNLDAAVFEYHDIVRLDVPVDNAAAVRMLQCLGNLNGEMQCLPPVEHTFLLHILLERQPIDQFHDDVIRIGRTGYIKNADDIGV